MPVSFSQRNRLAGPPPGTLLRDEISIGFRMFLVDLPHADVGVEIDDVHKVVCKVLQAWPNERLQPYYDYKIRIQNCAWFHIYDIIEGVYKLVFDRTWNSNPGTTSVLARVINEALVEQNIGWQLVDGKIVIRGDEAFEGTIKTAVTVLQQNAKPTAAGHLQFAISDLSARPKVNTSGAVAHATNAVECVMGEITGATMTLGEYLHKNPGLFHPALKKGLHGIYGYASEEGARHGKEGTQPALEEAEFAVAVCAAVCTLLTRKNRT